MMLVACGAGERSEGLECEPGPQSSALSIGESAQVDVAVIGGEWGGLDVAGAWWETEDRVPDGLAENGRVSGTATLAAAEYYRDGSIQEGTVRVELEGFGQVVFSGPVFCD